MTMIQKLLYFIRCERAVRGLYKVALARPLIFTRLPADTIDASLTRDWYAACNARCGVN
jgi:hypothetical protein